MDDILLPAASAGVLQQAYALLQGNLQQPVLVIAPGKVQRDMMDYLGHVVERQIIRLPKVSIGKSALKTLNDCEKLLGNINWLHPTLGIPNDQLQNLSATLEGDQHCTVSILYAPWLPKITHF